MSKFKKTKVMMARGLGYEILDNNCLRFVGGVEPRDVSRLDVMYGDEDVLVSPSLYKVKIELKACTKLRKLTQKEMSLGISAQTKSDFQALAAYMESLASYEDLLSAIPFKIPGINADPATLLYDPKVRKNGYSQVGIAIGTQTLHSADPFYLDERVWKFSFYFYCMQVVRKMHVLANHIMENLPDYIESVEVDVRLFLTPERIQQLVSQESQDYALQKNPELAQIMLSRGFWMRMPVVYMREYFGGPFENKAYMSEHFIRMADSLFGEVFVDGE